LTSCKKQVAKFKIKEIAVVRHLQRIEIEF